MLEAASSRVGKAVSIQNSTLKIYRGSCEKIHIFSLSVDVDETSNAVSKYVNDAVKMDSEMEHMYSNHYNARASQK